MLTFSPTWLCMSPPRRAWDAYRQFRRGTLSITRHGAVFRDRDGDLQISRIREVRTGMAGTDTGNVWIHVTYLDEQSEPRTVFIKDGAWLGWRPILLRTNEPIVSALRSITE